MRKNIRTLRGLRDLRGENVFRHCFLSADSVEESFALKFVQQAHIQKTGHLFLVFSERGNEIAPAIGFGSRNFCHAFRIEAIGLLQGCTKNSDRRLLKKISEARRAVVVIRVRGSCSSTF